MDLILSNLIVGLSHLFILFLSIFITTNSIFPYEAFNFFPPFGVIVLGILFFGNKVILSIILSNFIYDYISLYFFKISIFDNIFISMVTFSFCVPLAIFIINKLKLSIGMGPSYKFDKSNIYHVFFLVFISSVIFLFMSIFLMKLFDIDTKIYQFFLGNILGGISLIILLKLLVNIPYQLKVLFKK